MFWRVQLILGAAVFLMGVVLAIIALVEGRYWGFLGFIAAAVALAVSVVSYGNWMSSGFWLAPVCASALTCFSVLDVFASSHLINTKEASAQRDFVMRLMELEIESVHLNSAERSLVAEAFKTCSVQVYKDAGEMAANGQKALYFGPALTLADGVRSVAQGEQPLRCLAYYRELRKTQPQLFKGMEKRHPWLLKADPS